MYLLKRYDSQGFFGLAPSLYLLQGVIELHLDVWSERYPEEVEHLRCHMYVDNLLSGGLMVKQAEACNDVAKNLCKMLLSNFVEFECTRVGSGQQSARRGTFGRTVLCKVTTYGETQRMKVLGLKWDKQSYTRKVSFPSKKRGIFRKLARIYDPLELVSPLTLEGKLIH